MKDERAVRAAVVAELEAIIAAHNRGDEDVWAQLVDGRDGVDNGYHGLLRTLRYMFFGPLEPRPGEAILDAAAWRMVEARARQTSCLASEALDALVAEQLVGDPCPSGGQFDVRLQAQCRRRRTGRWSPGTQRAVPLLPRTSKRIDQLFERVETRWLAQPATSRLWLDWHALASLLVTHRSTWCEERVLPSRQAPRMSLGQRGVASSPSLGLGPPAAI